MKKIVLLSFLFVIASIALDGQTRKEKIQSLRKSVFTEELQLSEEEEKAFFPIYGEYDAEREKLQQRTRQARRQVELIPDEKVKQQMDLLFKLEEEQVALKRKYADRFMSVLPARKVLYIYKAEQAFRKRLLERVRDRDRM
ncbi:MAG: hypothetical protein AAF849_14485 [Bacteroidota bacterium]